MSYQSKDTYIPLELVDKHLQSIAGGISWQVDGWAES